MPFALVGKRVWLRATDTTVAVFDDYRVVATHVRARAIGTRRTVSEHLPPEAQAFFAHDRNWCCEQAQKIGAACAALVSKLLGDRVLERLRAAQGVLRLAERYGRDRLEAACARALAHDSPHYRTVKTILAGRYDQQPLSGDVGSIASVYVQQPRFVRPASELFRSDAAEADLLPPAANG